MNSLKEYSDIPFTHDGTTRRVFQRGGGHCVMLLHELPGLTPETVEFADWLVLRGYRVALPLLFGEPGQSAKTGLLKAPSLCIRHEFNCFRAGVASPITDWLRALANRLAVDCGGRGVAVIGMCFTGGFVLAIMLEETIAAAVAAEPSLPFFRDSALDISDADLARAAKRANEAPLLALRFTEDWRCPAERFERLKTEFERQAEERRKTFVSITVPGRGHSTLTFDYGKAVERGTDTRAAVLAFLQQNLG